MLRFFYNWPLLQNLIVARCLLCALLLIGCFLCHLTFGFAQESPSETNSETHRAELQRLAGDINDAVEDNLLALREEVRAVRVAADAEAAPLRTRIAQIQADIQRLGPEPKAGEGIPEPPSVSSLREQLNLELKSLDTIVGQADLNISEANRLLRDISNLRRDAFYERVLERDSPPFTLKTLGTVSETLKTDIETFKSRYADWKASFEDARAYRTVWVTLWLSALAAILLVWPLPLWIDQTLLMSYKTHEPTPSRRVRLAALRVMTRAIPALIAATLIYQVSIANGITTDESSKLVGSILLAFGTIFVVDDIVNAVFAPKEPDWRLLCMPSSQATLIRVLIVSIVIVFSANAVLNRVSEWLDSPRELVTFLSAVIVVTGAVLLFLLVRPGLWKLSNHRPVELSKEERNFWRWTRNLAGLVSVLAIFAVLVGHIALSRFVMTRIYYLTFLFVTAWFGRALLGELAERIGTSVSGTLSGTDTSGGAERKDDHRLFVFWLKLFVDITLFVITIPAGLLIIGVDWADMRNWVIDVFVGVEIGGVTISLSNIFSAFIVVFVIFAITRFMQRTIDTRILAPSRMESGLRNTMRTLIGYFGLVIGLIVGIGTLGFPLANLAIVAGALSLGIGFGLQSIVNNFVSGLILLFERPIKVGDWVVTSAGEGIVKRISVRSTEIETFDWASVIIPNAELVTAPVTNWTHKNRYTRLIVRIGVSYSSDPEVVSALLLKEAKANRRTLSYPAPIIFFSGFGDSSLDFEVRVFINNVDDRIPVQNELRFAIFKAFREAGIEIPFPQRDLHLRTLVPGMVVAGGSDAQSHKEAPLPGTTSDLPAGAKTEIP